MQSGKAISIEAKFLRERFREEFRPAFEAWIAKANTTNPIPPGTPFELPEYTLAKYTESASLEEKATAAFNEGKDANTNGRCTSPTPSSLPLFFSSVVSIHGGNQ